MPMPPQPRVNVPTKVLLVGGGGREHALAWKLAQSPTCRHIIAAPGNPGMALLPKVRLGSVKVDDVDAVAALARTESVDLVVCGPEGPLNAGLGDAVRAAGIAFFGPSRAAAEIEGSKAFAKRLMAEAGVPTAAFGVFDEVAAAERFIDAQPGPVVVKADGLCAGKGVVVASTKDESKAAVRRMIGERAFGAAGARVVLEERLFGREVSMMALCDGERLALLPSAEDHKAVLDGDQGPNTGGMGTYSPSPLVDEAMAEDIVARIFRPTVAAMRRRGHPFQGLLYGGLMLTRDRGPMVIEWNCRFGDPETQVVLVRISDDLLPWLAGAAVGRLPEGQLRATPDVAVCVVLAAANYPGPPRAGDAISGLPIDGTESIDGTETSDGVLVFQAGTRDDGGRLVTAGGRVVGVTARGADLSAARARAYGAIGTGPREIHFAGMHFRKDIGARGQT
jgi:phosphoribosylamine--glycine ligase